MKTVSVFNKYEDFLAARSYVNQGVRLKCVALAGYQDDNNCEIVKRLNLPIWVRFADADWLLDSLSKWEVS